ncbi:multidrug DMT transporter permease [Novimethylophilus kurashikiensis]|uniref:Multidrug DMT transporter permease n=1 Tax=Novimethylophilus kurashikiensis TaxID=1825523 RepID=A0A2R5FAC1_9PROT|nr:DMT family transporter [Novimethylophilus kurashikiensis]GBG15147.1 multidrug DMT transporter permease [Novimethylophilus kurashikiensis]
MTMHLPHRHALLGALMVFISAIGFSSKAVIVKLAYAYVPDPEVMLALRMAFAAPLFMGLWIWARSRPDAKPISRRDTGLLLFFGVLGGYAPMWFDFAGLVYVTAGLERVLLYLYPTMVLLIGAVRYHQHIGRREIFSLVASYAGVALAVGHDMAVLKSGAALTLAGAGLVLMSALTYASYIVFSGRVIPRIGSASFAAASMLVASVSAATHLILTHPVSSVLHLPAPVYGLGLLMAIVATFLPAILLSAGIHRIGSTRASLVGTIGPVSTIVLAYFFLGEMITPLQILGTALVMAGVLATSLQKH